MKIISILLNPTIDEIYEIENFYIGGTFKAKNKIVYPVGKAISFSLGIRELNQNRDLLKVVAFIGKEEIPLYSNFLNSKSIPFEFVKVEGKTRSNKTINDPINKTTTHIREMGFNVNAGELLLLIQSLENSVKEGDICVFCGSLPPNLEEDIYDKLITSCNEKGASCVLDTSGNALLEGIKANPKIIKPNLVELSQILKDPNLNRVDLSNIDNACKIIVERANLLLNNELEIVLITLGDKGAIFLSEDKVLYGNVIVDNVIDTVGSGDSFLAGFVLSYALNKDLKECFKHAIACGAANTLTLGPGIFHAEDVRRLLKKIEIKEIE